MPYTAEERREITDIMLTGMLKLIDNNIRWHYCSEKKGYGIEYLGIWLTYITYDELISGKCKELELLPQKYKRVADQLDSFRQPIKHLEDSKRISTSIYNDINRVFHNRYIQLHSDSNDKGTVQYFTQNYKLLFCVEAPLDYADIFEKLEKFL